MPKYGDTRYNCPTQFPHYGINTPGYGHAMMTMLDNNIAQNWDELEHDTIGSTTPSS